MMDLDGPGVIYRIWSANPMGKIRVYLDGAQTPSYEWNFPDLFDGKLPPFIKPLVYRRDSRPVGVRLLSADPVCQAHQDHRRQGARPILPLQLRPLPQGPAGGQLPAAARAPRSRPPCRPPPTRGRIPGAIRSRACPARRRSRRRITLAPGQTAELCALRDDGSDPGRPGPRPVEPALRLAQARARRARGMSAAWPQVLTPLGPFFGFDWETAEYGSVTAGCRDGQAYQYLPDAVPQVGQPLAQELPRSSRPRSSSRSSGPRSRNCPRTRSTSMRAGVTSPTRRPSTTRSWRRRDAGTSSACRCPSTIRWTAGGAKGTRRCGWTTTTSRPTSAPARRTTSATPGASATCPGRASAPRR